MIPMPLDLFEEIKKATSIVSPPDTMTTHACGEEGNDCGGGPQPW